MIEQDKQKTTASQKEIGLTIWFFGLLLLPIVILLLTKGEKDLFMILVDYLIVVGEPMILAGVVLIIVNSIKKVRPRFSINETFLILATGLMILTFLIR